MESKESSAIADIEPVTNETGAVTVARLVIIYLCFVVLRFMISLFFQEPWIMNDELQYKTVSYLFFKTGGIRQIYETWVPGFPKLNFTNMLYPLFLSPSFYFGDNFYTVMKLMNSFAMNASIFPLFLIAKEFTNPRTALWVSALVLLMPAFNFVNSAMAENLFFPLFLFCFYYAYKALVTLDFKNYVLLSIFLLIAFFTKPHIISFVAAFCIVSCYTGMFIEKRKEIWIYGLFTVLTFSFSIFMINSLIIRNDSVVGIYKEVMVWESLMRVHLEDLSVMVISNISSFLFLYLVPFVVSCWALLRFSREQSNREIVFLLLGLSSFLSLLAMANIFGVQIHRYGKINARLYFYVFPFFLISFFCFNHKVAWTAAQRLGLFFMFVATAFINFFVAFPKYATIPLISSNMDLTWIIYFYERHVPALVYIPCSAIILYYLFSRKPAVTPFLLLFVFMSFVANAAEVIVAKSHNDNLRDISKPCRDLLTSEALDGKIMLVDPSHVAGFNIPFWLNYNYNKTVYDFPASEVITREMVPEDTSWIVLFGNYRIAFPVTSIQYARNNCRVISLRKMNVTNKINQIYRDGWTEKEFQYRPEVSFETLVFTLSSYQPSYPNILTVEMDKGTELFDLKAGVGEITLPFSRYYNFKLDHTFVPQKCKINNDTRELGIYLESVYVY